MEDAFWKSRSGIDVSFCCNTYKDIVVFVFVTYVYPLVHSSKVEYLETRIW